MLTEQCVACGADVPLSSAVHMLVNPKGGEEVTDGYLCRSCYEEHVEPILPDEADDRPEVDPDAEGDAGADEDLPDDGDVADDESDAVDDDPDSDVADDAPAGEA